MLEIAGSALKRHTQLNHNGADETGFLQPLIEFAEANQTPYERKLGMLRTKWNDSVDPVFREFAYRG